MRKFEKIHRLGKDEVDGILEGTVHIEEKIDGANTSIWNSDGTIRFASRNQEITGGFNGFVEYIQYSIQGKSIQSLLKDYPYLILYGEWLVPHTILYEKDNYMRWYMYDVFNTNTDKYLTRPSVRELIGTYQILSPHEFGYFYNPIVNQLRDLVGKSILGNKGEGIVIKRDDFINRWGDRCYAKLVAPEFLEDNAITFNSNSKASEAYNEMYVINKWMTSSRVSKITNKVQPQIEEKLDMKHIPRIINESYHDLISEEAWEIAKLNKQIDFKKLRDLAFKKAKLLYVKSLEERG